MCENSVRWHTAQARMPLFWALWGIPTPGFCLRANSHSFFFFSFSFSSMRIPLTFFLTCYRRDFLRVTHLYSCLRLTASVWSLPHFQVHVITFSAPDCFSAVAAFPKPLVSSARGRKQDTCSSPWSHSKRTREWPPLAASPLLSP